MIGIPTESSLAAVELEVRLRDVVQAIQTGREDECVVLMDVSEPHVKWALEIVAEWAQSWSHGEVELLVDRRTYLLRAHKAPLNWTDLDRPGAPDLFRDLEL